MRYDRIDDTLLTWLAQAQPAAGPEAAEASAEAERRQMVLFLALCWTCWA